MIHLIKKYLKRKEKEYRLAYRYYRIFCPEEEWKNTISYKYAVLANECANLYKALYEVL